MDADLENGTTNSETDWSVFRNGRKSPDVSAPRPDDEVYKKYQKRGVAIIFNHKNFEISQCKPRTGTDKDRDDLYKLLEELKFDVKAYDDLSYRDIVSVLNQVSKADHSNNECLFVTVMTHGEDGYLFSKDHRYPTKCLWTPFSPLHCPTLAGKPKLFFIQACRGHKADPGFSLNYEERDSSKTDNVYSIPVMADFLIMYATVEGYYAWRDPVEGSWFIQALVNQLRKHHKTREFLSILTCVNRDVAVNYVSRETRLELFDKKKEMCSIVSMLTRDFYLH